jgi:Tn3 transposase DDE domain
MLRKLGAYPRQNALAIALRELGKLEGTLFLLEYIRDVELRRRIHIGLNKGEARNALARAVFFNRLGEMRDRSFENRRYRASGLNLVVAAIILWNTVYLERAIRCLKEHGLSSDVSGSPSLHSKAASHAYLCGFRSPTRGPRSIKDPGTSLSFASATGSITSTM